MIETSITEINVVKIENKITQELLNTAFIELPEEVQTQYIHNSPDPDNPAANLFRNGKVIYGLSYYLKKLKFRSYRNASAKKFLSSPEYRQLFFFLIRRALYNKVKIIPSLLHKKNKGSGK